MNADYALKLIESAVGSRLSGATMEPYITELSDMFPGVDVGILCLSDLPGETILELCIKLPAFDRQLNDDDFEILVRRMLERNYATEAESLLDVIAFKRNCSHPAGTDLILDYETYFSNKAFVTPKDIVLMARTPRIKE